MAIPVRLVLPAVLSTIILAGNLSVAASPDNTSSRSELTDAQDARYAALLDSLQPTRGPARIVLRDQATLSLPEGYVFIPETGGRRFMKEIGNQTDANFVGVILPAKRDVWFEFLEYVPAGYVRDDDAKTWNPDTILDQIRQNTEKDNAQRRQSHVAELEILGWVEKPHYDAATHRLIWSVSVRDKGSKDVAQAVINYRTLMLGREGLLAMVMVTTLNTIEAQKPIARMLLSDLSFNAGKRYENFDASTDRVAEYGLAALVGGVVLKKLGLFALIAAFAAKFFKVIAVAVVGGLAAVGRLFRRKKAAPAAGDLRRSSPQGPVT